MSLFSQKLAASPEVSTGDDSHSQQVADVEERMRLAKQLFKAKQKAAMVRQILFYLQSYFKLWLWDAVHFCRAILRIHFNFTIGHLFSESVVQTCLCG